jgi:hypothetical protein
MKIHAKKTLIIDCSWEFEDNLELKTKLESLTEDQLIDYCFEHGNFNEGHKHHPSFKINYIGEIGDEFDF